jgi:hypothetical protein
MIKGSLFTQEFLIEGIKEFEDWNAISDSDQKEFKEKLTEIFKDFPFQTSPIEDTTEHDLIEPILKILGWEDFLTQQTLATKGRSDVPDYLLFLNKENKKVAQAIPDQWERYKHGLTILEAKAWDTPLDRKGKEKLDRVPSSQLLRYLTHVDVQSDGKIRWGILTNGRLWRLYYNRAKSKSEEFLELELGRILGIPGIQNNVSFYYPIENNDWLKVFYLIFNKESFIRKKEDKSFHEHALERGKYWETQVADDLSEIIFKRVFPEIINILTKNDPQAPGQITDIYLSEVRNNALTLLYRLLFILFAEDRNLLPVFDRKYDDYGLRKRIRENIAQRIDEKDVFSTTISNYYHHLKDLINSINKGDESIGLPPYDGGLFGTVNSEILNRINISDYQLANIIDNLSRRDVKGKRKWINYRDLSIQQLGSIYERLLEFNPRITEKGEIEIKPSIFARKTSGSYYTPESLVKVIIERTIGPLIKEKCKRFYSEIEKLKSQNLKKPEKNKKLTKFDPAIQILELKICDPAMGSGHFLVSLVDYLADQILESIDEAENNVPWNDNKNNYTSPLTERILSIREIIINQSMDHKWIINPEQLDDKHIVRKLILKRCIYGIDKNPMAVELAKVSLWLHTFTVGTPLSFVDHHLRCGDSLFGEWIFKIQSELSKRGLLLSNQTIQSAKQAAEGMQKIEKISDAEIAEAELSALIFNTIEDATRPLNNFLRLYHGLRWLNDGSRENQIAINAYLDSEFGDIIKVAMDEIEIIENSPQATTFNKLFKEVKRLISEEHFFNWQTAFPGVWQDWESENPEDGFDAIIGNPPWDRFEFEETPWFALRDNKIAFAIGNKRKKLIQNLKTENLFLWNDYEKARSIIDMATKVIRKSGLFSFFSSGKLNLYTLFVEKAHQLVKSSGIVGLLVPSGIYGDKRASNFFSKISTNSRLGYLFDFENKKIFFHDIDTRFKFCIYITGGENRKFNSSEMAFYLHDIKEINERKFFMTAEDFKKVNPNTGTSPIFRTHIDAEITKMIYSKFPIINHKLKGKIWPIKYIQMFNITSDSDKLLTEFELKSKGYYPINNCKWKKGDEIYTPLFEGKMIQAYDHRAAKVIVNPNNLNRPGQPQNTILEEYQDVNYCAVPQYWIDEKELKLPKWINYFLGYKRIGSPTNFRTFIASFVPRSACEVNFSNLIPDETINNSKEYSYYSPLLLANLNSLIFDFITRQKLQGQTLNWYIVEQLPIIPADLYKNPLGNTIISDLIKENVLHLTYTAWDMQSFAIDLGYEGEPFIWDEEDRLHRKCKLDALFFNLYEISEEDANYILSTFPIVKRNDIEKYGKYRTKDLILAYMKALRTGDTKVLVDL